MIATFYAGGVARGASASEKAVDMAPPQVAEWGETAQRRRGALGV